MHSIIGSRTSRYLSQMHAVTGCDATPFFHGIKKVKILKKLWKDDSSLILLKVIERLNKEGLADASRFLQAVLYKGRLRESLVETRIRLHQGLKTEG